VENSVFLITESDTLQPYKYVILFRKQKGKADNLKGGSSPDYLFRCDLGTKFVF
jgi:hypothetical protein